MEEGKSLVKNPANWKLVSRNGKQWMKKRYFKVKRKWWSGFTTLYGW
ncbi:hypothetical protein [Niastella sp. OAS944]|nr:hypothetical protein [Chitinophagaceae bacterium OAS944]